MEVPTSKRPLVPNKEGVDLSREILKAAFAARPSELVLETRSKKGGQHSFRLTPDIAHLIVECLSKVARGSEVRVLEVPKEVSTHEAAELLNVSRTHLIGLLNKG